MMKNVAFHVRSSLKREIDYIQKHTAIIFTIIKQSYLKILYLRTNSSLLKRDFALFLP